MDRVTLSQAVDSICDPDSAPNSYLGMDNDLMYMDQTVGSNSLHGIPFSKDSLMNETITSFTESDTGSKSNEAASGIGTAMSQYVNALKNAGLPTDLPILFESGDGSYINVNERVLLDMVQSSEIQYEVIEQPNIIEKVADPSEIKSIDDLSKSIERGEMLMGAKSYGAYDKGPQYDRHEDTINSLSAILPDNLESFSEQQNYVVLGQELDSTQPNMDPVNSHDFSCIDSDMQFFTKSISDDVKKYYEDQQLTDARVMEQLCPSTSLDTSFNMSLLDTKITNINDNMSQSTLEDLRRNEDCYDFSLQLPQSADFKEDPLDCLISSTKQSEIERNDFNHHHDDLDKRAQERDALIDDLINIEEKIRLENSKSELDDVKVVPEVNFNVEEVFQKEICDSTKEAEQEKSNAECLTEIVAKDLQWNAITESNKTIENNNELEKNNHEGVSTTNNGDDTSASYSDEIIDLTECVKLKSNHLDDILNGDDNRKESEGMCSSQDLTLEGNIPFAVGLLPLKHIEAADNDILLKRKSDDSDSLNTVDAKCLKRKVKQKKL